MKVDEEDGESLLHFSISSKLGAKDICIQSSLTGFTGPGTAGSHSYNLTIACCADMFR